MLLPSFVSLVQNPGGGLSSLTLAWNEIERYIVSVYGTASEMEIVTRYCHAIIIKVKIFYEKVLHFVYMVLY